jgi:hypothetical protein
VWESPEGGNQFERQHEFCDPDLHLRTSFEAVEPTAVEQDW